MNDLTVLIPFKRDGRQDWLQEALASIPSGLPYMVLENDGELAEALNTGLREAKTEYVIRLDADDLLDDDSVQLLLDAAWNVDVAYPELVLVTEDLQPQGVHAPGEFCPNRLLVWNYIPGAGCVIRRHAALDVGGYRDLEALEDWDLWVRMSLAGKRFKNHPEARYFYRQVEGSRNKMPPEKADALKRLIVGALEPPLAATFYSQETVATTYWRCLLPSRFLPGQTVLHRPTIQVNDEEIALPHHRGSAVWQFPGFESERFCMAAMQELGVPVLIETDDTYLTRRPYGLEWTTKMPARERTGPTKPSIEMHRRICKWVDGVIVTTEHLGRQYRKVTDAPVFVCPNQIDPADWALQETPDWYDPNKTYVGFSGSGAHMQDIGLIAPALEWASKQRDVEILVLGSAPRQWANRFSFRFVPWTTDLAVYRQLQQLLDIGLAPIIENPWSVCRSDLKVLEYAMGSTATVVSDAIPYRGWKDGEHVVKAKDAKGFLRAVQELVNTPSLRYELAGGCREHVLAERTVERNIDLWREAVSVPLREAVAA